MKYNTKKNIKAAAIVFLVWTTISALVTVSVFGMVTAYRLLTGKTATSIAIAECTTLGGTLIISADERYICVPDAKEIDP